MGNTSNFESLHNRGDLIQRSSSLQKLTQHGHKIIEPTNKTNNSSNTLFQLIDLYPYLTYNGSINHIISSLTLLENIANIISVYAAIKNYINKSFSFKVYIDKNTIPKKNSVNVKPYFNYIENDEYDIFTSILCGCSWNGLVYLITPINNKSINANLYMIDGGYFAPKSKQQQLRFELNSSKYSLDPHFCCVVSHIVAGNDDPRSAMIIDGIILVNSGLDTIYGYHINNGLFVLKQFNYNETIQMIYDNENEYNIINKPETETIINLWRQNIDAFVLTSKFNLYAIRIQQNSFKITKICTFLEGVNDIKDISKYSNCWYDVDTKILFLVYKNMNTQTVHFKMYGSDRIIDGDDEPSVALDIVKSLQNILNDNYNYLMDKKSFLFYHKPSDTLLLFFGTYLIQITIDFRNKTLKKTNIGVIDDLDFHAKQIYDQDIKLEGLRRDVIRLKNIANFVYRQNEDAYVSINSELINAKPLPPETSICDHIIGYDEFRSCIILNFNQYHKELSTLYKFEISIKRATDFASDWTKLLPV